MSQLSAKVNIDREKGGVSMNVYGGYLKACGMIVVTIALATSFLAQVRVGGGFPHRLTAKLTLILFARNPSGLLQATIVTRAEYCRYKYRNI